MKIRGRWIRGEFAEREAYVVNVSGDHIVTIDGQGRRMCGQITDFMSDAGNAGMQLEDELQPAPRVFDLEYGAVRESIAHLSGVSLHGAGETRCWDSALDYVVDDGEGRWGIVGFSLHGWTAVLSRRGYDDDGLARAVAMAPGDVCAELTRLGGCALMEGRATVALWGGRDDVRLVDSWSRARESGASVLDAEFLPDAQWVNDIGVGHYGLSRDKCDVVIRLARTFVPGRPLELTSEALDVLVDPTSPYQDEARRRLAGSGRLRCNDVT